MIMRSYIVALVLLTAVSANAQGLTQGQLATLKANISASTDLVQAGTLDCGAYVGLQVNAVSNTSDGNACLSRVYALTASPTFTVWKTNVPKDDVANKGFNPAELAGLTQVNAIRLQLLADWFSFVNPSQASVRQFFDDIFSGAGGANTRAALLVLWKRLANRGERVYATGTGSDAVPGLLVFEGTLTADIIQAARNLP